MEKRLVEADADFVPVLEGMLAAQDRRARVHGVVVISRGEPERQGVWKKRDGEWLVERDVPDLKDMRRDGRAPVVIEGDTMDALVAAHNARPSQGDVKDALKGLEPTPVEDPFTGETREDFANIPLKHSDGSLTRYAKNLMDLHAPAVAKSDVASVKLGETFEKASDQ